MEKRERILLEAEKLFARKGYYGLSLGDLLKQCQIPKGSFYYYFPNGKVQLIQETLRYSYQRMAKAIEERILTADTALASFERMVDHLAAGILSDRTYASLFMTMVSIESVYMDECINQTCRELYEQWQALYAAFLRRFGFEETVATRKAQAIFALIHGSMVSSWIKRDPTDLMLARISLRDIIGE